ncbi:hypothetical protein SynA1560_00679 [Synechococcus sp. A15-60]|nr:hypothetical protein SynA1560_00679 [Synechococcus sp. A15-60]
MPSGELQRDSVVAVAQQRFSDPLQRTWTRSPSSMRFRDVCSE